MKQLNCVLFIDDNKHTNILNKRVADKLKIIRNIFYVSNGKEALDFLSHKGQFVNNGNVYPKPDLIFLDINMPVMDGWEFLKKFEQLPLENKEDTKIVMLTTSPNPDDQIKAMRIPQVNGFTLKPLTTDVLIKVVEKNFPE